MRGRWRRDRNGFTYSKVRNDPGLGNAVEKKYERGEGEEP